MTFQDLKKKKIAVILGVVLLIGTIAGVFLIYQIQDYRRQASEQVTYQIEGNTLVIQYNGFQDSVFDVNVRYASGETKNYHEQFSEPIGTQTKSISLEDECVEWIQVHGTNYHYENDCDGTTPTPTPTPTTTSNTTPTATPTPTSTATLTPTPTPTNTSTVTPTPTSTTSPPIGGTSPTPTPTATISLTPTPTPTVSGSPTPTPTTSPPIGGTTTTPTATPSGSATPNPSNSPGVGGPEDESGSTEETGNYQAEPETLPAAGGSDLTYLLATLGGFLILGALVLLVI